MEKPTFARDQGTHRDEEQIYRELLTLDIPTYPVDILEEADVAFHVMILAIRIQRLEL